MRATNRQLTERAVAAYYLAASRGGPAPRPGWAEVATCDGRDYVVIRGAGKAGGVLAVYRVRAYDGVLKRLRRWPRALVD